ncbi:MAG: FMN-binding protein [Nitrososphaeraceae archaeon]|nr:FMN-binding protein [Nitrososphaeraceae archaeon]
MKYLIILFITVQNYFCLAQEIKELVDKKLKSTFASEVNIEFQKFELPSKLKNKIQYEAKQQFYSDFVYLYKVYSKDEVKAYAILDNVLGKEQPITFLVIVDKTGTIISSEVIKYREPYGGSVQNKSWNDQFIGINNKSKLIVGEDIDGISGATISVNSVTKGIKKLLILFNLIKNDL